MTKRNIIAALLAMSASAFAGAKYNYSVYVGTTLSWGAMGTARASADNYQYIGCTKYANNSYSSVTCTAHDSTGKAMSCYSRTNAEMKDVVSGISDGAYIAFQLDSNDNTKCGMVQVDVSSAHAPPQP